MALLSITRPVAGNAILASDIDTIADQLEAWSTTLDATNIAAIPAHAGNHGIDAVDGLQGSYVAWGTASLAAGIILRTAARFTFQGGALNPTLDWASSGAPSLIQNAAPANSFDLLFTGYVLTRRYLIFGTYMGDAQDLGVLRVTSQVASGIRFFVINSTGASTQPAIGQQYQLFVFEVTP